MPRSAFEPDPRRIEEEVGEEPVEPLWTSKDVGHLELATRELGSKEDLHQQAEEVKATDDEEVEKQLQRKRPPAL